MEFTSPSAKLAFESTVSVQGVLDYLAAGSDELVAVGMESPWSPEVIGRAIVAAARDYNSIPPTIDSVHPGTLSTHTNMFYDGAAYHAYRMLHAQLSRRDIDHQAGGVTTNLVSKQIAHAEKMMQTYRTSFVDAVRTRKNTLNQSFGYGRVG